MFNKRDSRVACRNEIAAVPWNMYRVVRRQTDIRGHGSVGTVSTGVLTGSAFQLLGVVVGRGGGSVVTGTSSPEDCAAPMAGVYNVFFFFRSNEYLLERQPSIFNRPA